MNLINKKNKVPVVKLPKPDTPDLFYDDQPKKNKYVRTYHIEKAPTWKRGRKWF